MDARRYIKNNGRRSTEPIYSLDNALWVNTQATPETTPRSWITPTVAGVATSEILLDAGATTTVKELVSALFTLSAATLTAAGVVIEARSPDCPSVYPGHELTVFSDTAITNLFACGVSATVDAAASNVIVHSESTDATIRAALTQFEFDSSDNVKSVVVSMGPVFGVLESTSYTKGQYALLRVWGRSHG